MIPRTLGEGGRLSQGRGGSGTSGRLRRKRGPDLHRLSTVPTRQDRKKMPTGLRESGRGTEEEVESSTKSLGTGPILSCR